MVGEVTYSDEPETNAGGNHSACGGELSTAGGGECPGCGLLLLVMGDSVW